jgi:hypothetical protein
MNNLSTDQNYYYSMLKKDFEKTYDFLEEEKKL